MSVPNCVKYRKIAPKAPMKEECDSVGIVDDSSSVIKHTKTSVIYVNTQEYNKLQSSEDPREKKDLTNNPAEDTHQAQSQSYPRYKQESKCMSEVGSVHLNLPHPASVNLMTMPIHYTREVEKRMKEAESNFVMFTSDIFLVAQIETDFLVTKNHVSFYTECGFLDWMVRYKLGKVDPAMLCTAVMVSRVFLAKLIGCLG